MWRALIDWDFDARGISVIDASDGGSEGQPRNGTQKLSDDGTERPQRVEPMTALLSASLLERLHALNDPGSSLAREAMSVARHEEKCASLL